jgi:UDP:flavonoid glycosyltransferase YjiC (YdhE family)
MRTVKAPLNESGQHKPHPEKTFRWAFFTYAYNYGDCSRAIEIGKGMRDSGHTVKFFIHGGRHMDKIREAGLPLEILKPEYTEEQDKILMDIDQHRAPLGTPLPFTEEQLRAMVEANISAFKTFNPDAVYCGLDLSGFIAVQYLKLPMVTFVPTALCPAFFEKGLASFPNAMETNPLIRYLVPSRLKKKLINKIMLGDSAKKSGVIYNEVRRQYGLTPVYNYTALVKGDLTLLPDLPELSGLPADDLPKGYAYTGPVFATLSLPVPEAVTRVFARPGLKIYLAMGSSGTPELLKKITKYLRCMENYNIVCATTTIISPEELGPPSDNFYATRFLPAHLVNEMADLAVIHGGQGTVQTAAWCGTPVVGIGMQWEQQANLDGLANAGMGIRIPLHSVTRKNLLTAVEKAASETYVSKAKQVQALVRSWDGVQTAIGRMNRFAAERMG